MPRRGITLLDNFGKPFPRADRAAHPRLRARYDAAQTNDENRRHSANADALSANTANAPDVRAKLRSRARYEVANNSYAAGIVQTLVNDTIGTGPRLQMLTGNRDADRRIEQAFNDWAGPVRLAEKLRLMRGAKCVDGEGPALLSSNPGLPTDVQLDLRPFESEMLATPWGEATLDGREVDGIRFDRYGNPAEYHVLRHHPGDGWTADAWGEFDRVKPSQIIHWFRATRPGQARGIPELMPALPLFAQLRRYTLAVIAAAETAADFAALLETTAPADEDAEVPEPFESLEIERRMMTTLPAGTKMAQLRAEQPATTYEMFKREILTEIARCLNMPFNVAAGNSSSYNYASGRLDHQTYFKSIRVERDHCELAVLDPLLLAWFDEAMLIPGLLPDGLPPFALMSWQWFWPGWEHVDPQKEASAQETRLANHTTTLAAEYARQGLDWEEALEQRGLEIKRMQELGLTASPAKPAQAAAPMEEDAELEEANA